MNIAEYSIQNKVLSWLFVVLLSVGGLWSFFNLSQLEFPAFSSPQAIVSTIYPGASPEQVEEEVTLPIEKAIQKLEYVDTIDSITSAGVSQVIITLDFDFESSLYPQIWDELRRKVGDIQSSLPPGVYTSVVNDDFSNVYGILYNISGEGYNYRELQNYGDQLVRELSLVDGVKNVNLAGTVSEQVVIEISQTKIASLGLDPSWIFGLIQTQNVVSNAGKMLIDGNSVRIHPTGEFNDLSELEQLVISPPGMGQMIYLGDIAKVYKSFEQTPRNLYYSNNEKAISMGISFAKKVNVVEVGQRIAERLVELESIRPVGVELTKVYNQPEIVEGSIDNFLVSLAQAIAIVIIVLLCTMGLKSGLLMGAVLLLTILGSFIGMYAIGIELQQVSLGALIIALGMLVDNAIVITEGVLVGIKKGQTRLEAINTIVKQSQWPLLGATVIAIMAFAPIGLSKDVTGDFLGSLFQVLLIALFLSWILAITLTPFFCHLIFKDPGEALVGSEADPYKGGFFVAYRGLLSLALRHRIISMALTIAALVLAVTNFSSVKQAFFPPSNTPIFFVDAWMQEGTDIRETERRMQLLADEVMAYDNVKNITTTIGMGGQRFILTYIPEKVYSSYGQLIVETNSLGDVRALLPEIQEKLESAYPDIDFKLKQMQNGPPPLADVEIRFSGSDPEVLRQLGDEAMRIFQSEPTAGGIRHSWRDKTTIVRPQLDEAAARRSGVSKQMVDSTLLLNYTGKTVGVYRDGSHLLPIVARAPEDEQLSADHIADLQVWSSEKRTYVPITQVVTGFETEMENPLIIRRNLRRTLSVMANTIPFSGETSESIRQKLRADIEAMVLPEGYSMEWGGEYEKSVNARGSVVSTIPLGYLAMFLITVFLFGTIRQPLAIWFTVPLGIIGVAVGLLATGIPFTFTALLGVLSLTGMLLKNGIVLVEQINIESREDKTIQKAILDACVCRVRPVCMAALTTMLGMIPLIFDAFFSSMAVSIIFGLGFATVFTLIVLPVTYSLLHRIRFDMK